MNTDDDFTREVNDAARRLRAAVSAAIAVGVPLPALRDIVEQGVNDARSFHITRDSQLRAARLGLHPDGAPTPPPVLPRQTEDEQTDAAGGFVVPQLHPFVSPSDGRRAA